MPVSRGSELPTTSFSKLEPLSSDNPLSALKIQPWRSKVSLATLALMIFTMLLAGCYLGSKVYCAGSIYCLRRSAEALDTNHLIGSNTSKSYDTSRTSLYSNPTNNDKVIIYAYYETPAARINFEFFLKHALHAHADFIFILNGPTNIDETIPRANNIRIVRKENTCYDLGSYGIVLNENEREVVHRYRWFVMMNASIRGPFMPHWSDACWSDSYLSKVTDRVKVSNCPPPPCSAYSDQSTYSLSTARWHVLQLRTNASRTIDDVGHRSYRYRPAPCSFTSLLLPSNDGRGSPDRNIRYRHDPLGFIRSRHDAPRLPSRSYFLHYLLFW